MGTFLYRCPKIGYQVQGFVADNDRDGDKNDNEQAYEGRTCAACGSVHFVNPKTGKVLDANAEQRAQGK